VTMGGAIFQRWFQDERLREDDRMTRTISTRQRFWMPLVLLALAVALALGGCARHNGASNGAPASSQSTTSPGQSAGASDVQQLEQLDQQTQNDLNSLDTDENNANQNPGSDQETQP
jgi:uncharacterized protein YceK